jgi:hypothetical protein
MTRSAEPPTGAPRTSRRQAIAAVGAGLLATGVPVGGLWAWIAPAVHGVVALTHNGDRVNDYPGNESEHFFVAAFLMLGLLSGVAVVAAVLAWQWRAHRGAAMLAGLCVGMVLAAADAAAVGALLVHLHYGTMDFAAAPVTHDNPVYYFAEAPPVFFGNAAQQAACTLLLPAATAALVYAALAAATARDDLGGYPAIDSALPAAAVNVSAEASALS